MPMGFFGIGVFEMVVFIVLIVTAAGVIKSYLKTSRIRPNKETLERLDALEQRVGDQSLEERVRVLEEIVTSKSEQLKTKIDTL